MLLFSILEIESTTHISFYFSFLNLHVHLLCIVEMEYSDHDCLDRI